MKSEFQLRSSPEKGPALIGLGGHLTVGFRRVNSGHKSIRFTHVGRPRHAFHVVEAEIDLLELTADECVRPET